MVFAWRIVYRVGIGMGLETGKPYVSEIEYPDDDPRTFFMANRAADFVRGCATGAAVPALPSTVVINGTSHPEVILRSIPTAQHGVYYLVVNSSWHQAKNVEVRFPATQKVAELPGGRSLGKGVHMLDLQPAELRAFHCK